MIYAIWYMIYDIMIYGIWLIYGSNINIECLIYKCIISYIHISYTGTFTQVSTYI